MACRQFLRVAIVAAFPGLSDALPGPICILGEPGSRCVEGSGPLSALKVTGLCEVKMVPMKLEFGSCAHHGFTCERKTVNDTMLSGVREFDAPAAGGLCSNTT